MKAYPRKPNPKCMLLYGFSPAQLAEINRLAVKQGIQCREVTPFSAGATVEELFSGNAAENPEHAPVMPVQKFAVLDGFGKEVQPALDILNRTASGVIKAIRTAHNNGWHFDALCGAILEEHEAIRRELEK